MQPLACCPELPIHEDKTKRQMFNLVSHRMFALFTASSAQNNQMAVEWITGQVQKTSQGNTQAWLKAISTESCSYFPKRMKQKKNQPKKMALVWGPGKKAEEIRLVGRPEDMIVFSGGGGKEFCEGEKILSKSYYQTSASGHRAVWKWLTLHGLLRDYCPLVQQT